MIVEKLTSKNSGKVKDCFWKIYLLYDGCCSQNTHSELNDSPLCDGQLSRMIHTSEKDIFIENEKIRYWYESWKLQSLKDWSRLNVVFYGQLSNE